MTSNHGAEHMFKGLPKDEAHSKVMREVESRFRPEFLNRPNEKVRWSFNHTLDQTRKIALLYDNDVIERAVEDKVQLQFTQEALNLIATKGYDEKYGTRPFGRYFEIHVALKLSKMQIRKVMDPGSIVQVGENVEMKVLIFGKRKKDASVFEEIRFPKKQKVQWS